MSLVGRIRGVLRGDDGRLYLSRPSGPTALQRVNDAVAERSAALTTAMAARQDLEARRAEVRATLEHLMRDVESLLFVWDEEGARKPLARKGLLESRLAFLDAQLEAQRTVVGLLHTDLTDAKRAQATAQGWVDSCEDAGSARQAEERGQALLNDLRASGAATQQKINQTLARVRETVQRPEIADPAEELERIRARLVVPARPHLLDGSALPNPSHPTASAAVIPMFGAETTTAPVRPAPPRVTPAPPVARTRSAEPNGQPLVLLQISDLKAALAEPFELDATLEALWRDLERLARQEARPGLVCVVGDITQSGQAEEFQLAGERFFTPLLERLMLGRERLFWVAGNHDVDRAVVERDRFTEQGARATLVERDRVDRVLADETRRAVLFRRLAHYSLFTRHYFGDLVERQDPSRAVSRVVEIEGLRVGVACLNSAWRSAGDADRGRLLLGWPLLSWAREQLESADLRIALLHHPFDWLHPHEATETERWCREQFDLVLHGHLHDNWTDQARLSGEGGVLPVGGLRRARVLQGYSLVNLTERRVQLRRFDRSQNEFVSDTLSAPEGVTTWGQAARASAISA